MYGRPGAENERKNFFGALWGSKLLLQKTRKVTAGAVEIFDETEAPPQHGIPRSDEHKTL
jgi:hypothetical protein